MATHLEHNVEEAHSLLVDASQTEVALAHIWREVLQVSQVGVLDNFFEIGGDSLLALEVVSRIRASLEVELPLLAFFEEPTVRYLASTIERSKQATSRDAGIIPVERAADAPLPLSSAQRRFWLLQQLDPASYVYNEPRAVRIRGNLDVAALESSLNQVYRRHGVLRSIFRPEADGPVQMVGERAPLRLAVDDLTSLAAEEREAAAISIAVQECQIPFDLSTGPLLRVRLLRLDSEDHILILVIHHVCTDGHTTGILLDELGAIYNALTGGEKAPLPAVAAQYSDYAVWEEQRIQEGALNQELTYWRMLLDGAPATLPLPRDYAHAQTEEHRGGLVDIEVDAETCDGLKRLAQESGATLFQVLLAGMRILLCRWTGEDDFAVGTVASNRSLPETERMVGCFVNFLPLRDQVIQGESACDLIKRNKQLVMDAFAHQECPFEKIVEAVNPRRIAGTNPLYNVGLVMRNFPEICLRGESFVAKVFKLNTEVSLLDLRFSVSESATGLCIESDFKAAFFRSETIRALLRAYLGILQQMISNPATEIRNFAFPQQLIDQAAAARTLDRHKAGPIAGDSGDTSVRLGVAPGPSVEREGEEASAPAGHDGEQDQGCSIVIASTFTAEPIEDALQFWMSELGISSQTEFAPYNQVFQQLLDPCSLLHGSDVIRVLLIRHEDWAGPAGSAEEDRRRAVEERMREFARTLRSAAHVSDGRYLVMLCPASRRLQADPVWKDLLERIDRQLVHDLDATPGVQIVTASQLHALYPVEDYEDEYADKLGHIPYTTKFYSALGTMLARRIYGLRGQKYKVIALDCDGTLWGGICGEDGASGISIDAPRQELQRFMKEQQEAGMLLCLCSKNNPDDVTAVFADRADMLLTRADFAAERVNWLAKSRNLCSLAEQLQLGLDSFIFIDDSPVECAEVESNCPEVLTLQVPEDVHSLPQFLRHVWAFDHHDRTTQEDRERTQKYRQHAERELLREDSLTLESFIATLDLTISIDTLQIEDVSRVAQLTQRTNQFNASAIRRNEAEIEDLLRRPETSALVVRVSDRFGDYGLVGVVIFESRGEALWVDTLLLSCRALGRNVERAMLDRVITEARERGHTRLQIAFRQNARNVPVLSFLESLAGEWSTGVANERVLEMLVDAPLRHQAVPMPALEFEVEAKR